MCEHKASLVSRIRVELRNGHVMRASVLAEEVPAMPVGAPDTEFGEVCTVWQTGDEEFKRVGTLAWRWSEVAGISVRGLRAERLEAEQPADPDEVDFDDNERHGG